LAGHIGYEILLPVSVMEKLVNEISVVDKAENFISLYIYYYQTDRQPKPVLIGFNSEDEKDFFQVFISVDAIGPLKAVKAMEKSISQIATAIEQQDIDFLSNLKGIGKRTAQKIVATLHGKVSRFISEPISNSDIYNQNPTASGLKNAAENSVSSTFPLVTGAMLPFLSIQKIFQQVVDVLVEQLGYTSAIARKMVSIAMEKNPSISTPEELFEAVLNKNFKI